MMLLSSSVHRRSLHLHLVRPINFVLENLGAVILITLHDDAVKNPSVPHLDGRHKPPLRPNLLDDDSICSL